MKFWDFVKQGWNDKPTQKRIARGVGFNLARAGSLFDWITPTLNIFQTVINDPTPLQTRSWTFLIPYDQALKAGYNANDVDELMEKHGIKTWGKQYSGTTNEYFFSVRRGQANFAEYLLGRWGIPIDERFAGAPAPKEFVKETIEGELVDQPKKSNALVLFLKAGRE